jgi:hypothetical protein
VRRRGYLSADKVALVRAFFDSSKRFHFTPVVRATRVIVPHS